MAREYSISEVADIDAKRSNPKKRGGCLKVTGIVFGGLLAILAAASYNCHRGEVKQVVEAERTVQNYNLRVEQGWVPTSSAKDSYSRSVSTLTTLTNNPEYRFFAKFDKKFKEELSK